LKSHQGADVLGVSVVGVTFTGETETNGLVSITAGGVTIQTVTSFVQAVVVIVAGSGSGVGVGVGVGSIFSLGLSFPQTTQIP
jgi:hypothetical protein